LVGPNNDRFPSFMQSRTRVPAVDLLARRVLPPRALATILHNTR